MADFTYDGSTITDMAAGGRVPAGTPIELRATPDGDAVVVYDLLTGAPMSLVASSASSYPAFGADIPEGWLVAGGGPPNKVVSNEQENALPIALEAAASSAAAQVQAANAVIAAAAAQAAAEAALAQVDTPAEAVVEQVVDDKITAGEIVSPAALNAGLAEKASITHRPINVAEAYGRTDTAVRAAFAAAASSGRALHFTNGDFAVTGNLTVTTRVELIGDGYTSRILFTDGGLILDATAANILHPKIRDLRIRRTGTVAGPALHLKGAGVLGVARLTAYNVHVSSPAGNSGPGESGGMATAGDALLVEGSFLAYWHGCYFEEAQYGIRGIVSSGGATGVNSFCFYGGEVNGNQYGWDFERPTGVSFFGVATEGNYARGGRVRGLARGFVYSGGYFERNHGPDVEVDCNAAAGGIVIDGNTFNVAGVTKTECVLLKRGRVAVNSNHFGLGFAGGAVPIRVTEGSSPILGEARNNVREDAGTIITYTTGGAAFNVTQVGQVTKASTGVLTSTLNEEAGIAFTRTLSAPLDFPSIAANAEATLTVSVPGVITSDVVNVSSGILEAGLILKSYGVTAADTVSICLRNVTAAAIDPIARSYRIRVWR